MIDIIIVLKLCVPFKLEMPYIHKFIAHEALFPVLVTNWRFMNGHENKYNYSHTNPMFLCSLLPFVSITALCMAFKALSETGFLGCLLYQPQDIPHHGERGSVNYL